ncbi:hypothetical protein EDD37DRAFT_387832 [Exophiala viscosa]|uniref:Fe2OG dioxygenase domain-containing protein n=1 Tax=Exophiala viscosa TaxID=2486360 RepID=A0AAN6DP33_9EURO|nr:hypothetical protein EDD36DRAFT_92365 [Exophiala viscosa]KAI1625454.1 hypothetical protein EDD37DRAFT_387832 [Exophiala viscosa]
MLFPIDSLPTGPPVKTKQALILLDLQNDFVSLDGKMPVANVLPFLPNLIPLVADFREKGEVIWVGTEYKQPRSDISPVTGSHSILLKHNLKEQNGEYEENQCLGDPDNTRSPSEDPLAPSKEPDVMHDREAFLAPVLTTTRYRCCIPGSVGIEYPDAINAAMDSQRDLVMLKSHYSAFVDTSLLMHLRTRLITELYICGSLSNIAVYATVLDAVCHGLQVTIIEDCLGYNDASCHVEAVRQMADDMGAKGIDSQELRDDLAGLLGDVIREEDFTTKFEVSLPTPTSRSKSHTSRNRVHDWVSKLDNGDSGAADLAKGRNPSKSGGATVNREDSKTTSDSSAKSTETTLDDRSTSRKRSTSDLEPLGEDRISKLPHKPSSRRSSDHNNPEQSKRKQNSPTARQRRPPFETSTRSATTGTIKAMTQMPVVEDASASNDIVSEDGQSSAGADLATNVQRQRKAPKKNKKVGLNVLGPNDEIGQGNSHVYLKLLDASDAERAFHSCKKSIKWQKMFHKSGEVPRLVAVQGDISKADSQVPIYRHPADESPELLPFDSIVGMLREAAERAVGHRLNHALVQMYRSSEDNISEHSDKTLDIVRGSSIVNLSLGAQRTMILRMKKSATSAAASEADANETRPSQRIHLPHNSLFILGQETNQHWLHSIRADKRPAFEKDPAELAFDGERISLTFRYIGTFIDPAEKTIWGQGATSKQRTAAQKLLDGPEAEKQGEEMIRAFGQENHRSSDWNWDEWYGKGFDVVNFETKTVEVRSEELTSAAVG